MLIPELVDIDSLEASMPLERERLVRLCARLTGDADAAEDLAQETLIEAWRNAHKLRDPEACGPWLSAIARNVCLRWKRAQGRERTQHVYPPHDREQATPSIEDSLADEFDLEVELERHELAELLDRAMALLPAETRTLLVQRYVEESPVAEVAERLRLSEGAVTMRLQRGKLQLRRVLLTDMKEVAAAYGLLESAEGTFEETRIWCPLCGRRKLQGRFEPGTRRLLMTCPSCSPDISTLVYGGDMKLFDGVQGYKAALSRLVAWARTYYQDGLTRKYVLCGDCGGVIPVQIGVCHLEHIPALKHGVYLTCRSCGQTSISALLGIAFSLPEAQQFWRRHPKVRALPERDIEVAGRPAVVTSLASVTSRAQFDAVVDAETFQVLSIHGASHG